MRAAAFAEEAAPRRVVRSALRGRGSEGEILREGASSSGAPSPLAEILACELDAGAVVAGPTAATFARARALPTELALAPLSAPATELAPPWPGAPHYGAVAFDGTVYVDDELAADLEIAGRDLERAVARAAPRGEGEGRPTGGRVALARRDAAVLCDPSAAAVVSAASAAALRNAGAARVFLAPLAPLSPRGRRQLESVVDRVLSPPTAPPPL